MSESCGNCRFFKPQDGAPTGLCRRYPPVPVVGEFREVFDAGHSLGYWEALAHDLRPDVMPDDWCGEWLGENRR